MTEQLNQNEVRKFKGTVYAKLSSWKSVFSSVREIFNPILKGYRYALEADRETETGENYMELKLIDDTVISFTVLHNKKANNNFIELATFVSNMRYGTDSEKEKMVLEVLNFNYMMLIEFEINSDNDRSEFIMKLLLDVTEKLDGYLFMKQSGVSTFLNGNGEKVFPKI